MKGKKNYNKANNKPKRPAGRSSGKIKSHASPPSKNNPNEKRNQQGESIFLINMVQLQQVSTYNCFPGVSSSPFCGRALLFSDEEASRE